MRLFLLVVLGFSVSVFYSGAAVLDNSALLPKIVPDGQVKLEKLSADATASPDWVKSLIIVEANPAAASTDGTLIGLTRLLDHLAETGVNAVWLTPLQEGRHYGNYGIHTLNRALTGGDTMPERWKVLRNFVDAAHRRNIRVFFDIVSWGVNEKAPLYKEKPEWFSGPSKPGYHGYNWDWNNPDLREWYASRLVETVLMTGVDGFRCDCAPRYAGYEPFRVVRERLLNLGRKIILISEHASERKGVFDFDQLAFCTIGKSMMEGNMLTERSIVDVVRNGDMLGNVDVEAPRGRERYYSFPLSCHDSQSYTAKGDPVRFGYQALFSPFIPIWYLGEEWNNSYTRNDPPHWLHANAIDWKQLDTNRSFFESIKRMIRIRREYPEIFEYFPADHRNSNIVGVSTDRSDLLAAYARFRNGIAVFVVPNDKPEPAKIRVAIPYDKLGIAQSGPVTVTDLMANQTLCSGEADKFSSFDVELPGRTLGVYLVASGKK